MNSNPLDAFIPVEGSRHLAGQRYNRTDGVLTIKFKNGSIYAVHGFSQEDHDAFVGATSQGEHYHAFIKNRYHIEKVK